MNEVEKEALVVAACRVTVLRVSIQACLTSASQFNAKAMQALV